MVRSGIIWIIGSVLFVGIAIGMPSGPKAPAKQAPKPQKRIVDFNRDVRPILSEHCYKCHGPSAKDVGGGLRLDNPFSAKRDRGGAAVVEGHPDRSLIIARATAKNAALQMPPPKSGMKRLTPEQVETLRLWIEQGAKYKTHWSFVPPSLPAIPKVKDAAWPRNSIDRFVLAKLEGEGLKPEAEADRSTLIRRATLTLTGLLPTPEEVDAFLADKKPGAYERVVDRLLASPRYGEHQARFWLDAVRYGDTHGLHLDNERSVYPYRDWVVRAFNNDLPFDKFTQWQLAGDLLPNPTTEMRLATGYVRMNPTTSEGGAIEAEFLAKNTFDRVDTTSTVFLGLTVACARCHDHKYDPISHRDYFRLYAFFNSTADAPLDGNDFVPGPVMKAPTPEQDRALNEMRTEMASLQAAVPAETAKVWAAAANIDPPKFSEFEVTGPFKAGSYDAAFNNVVFPEPGAPTRALQWRPLDLKRGEPKTGIVGEENATAYIRATITSSLKRQSTLELGSDDGIKVWLNGQLVHSNSSVRALAVGMDKVTVTLQEGKNDLLIKVINGTGGDGVSFQLNDGLAARVNALYGQIKAGDTSPGVISQVHGLYLEAGPNTPAADRYRNLVKTSTKLEEELPSSLIAEELSTPRPSFVLKRGEYNLPTDRVYRAVPAALGTLSPKAPLNRLGLANWLIDKRHPLTSRVFVNRIWQQHFGTGIVKTAEDFGNQGEWPSHPELLDYLAVKFRTDGWSVKHLHRMILTSSAFRQRAAISKQKLERDPANRWISRGPRYRLDAEVIRDNTLFAGGILNEKIGGKGFRPYQPGGLWEAIAFPGSNTANYVQDRSSEIYRRSLYLFWKRTSPHPIMLAFDAPMREFCSVRRSISNTPTQALVTLNETALFESARFLGERLVATPGDDAKKLSQAFRLTLGRSPNANEAKLLTKSVSTYRARFRKDMQAATEVLMVGDLPRNVKLDAAEHAAWTMVASTLMNTDEFLTQH
ncbi:MAG: DUF1553 domain-containing protein [Fimbriimonas sp.]